MTREKAIEFVNSLISLRAAATDPQAIDAPAVYPTWKEGAVYAVDDRVLYNDMLYKVVTAHTSQADWMPDVAVSLFAKVLIPNENVIPEWVQPDSTNPYMTNDKVMYNDKIWISILDNNVWAPGVCGWEIVE